VELPKTDVSRETHRAHNPIWYFGWRRVHWSMARMVCSHPAGDSVAATSKYVASSLIIEYQLPARFVARHGKLANQAWAAISSNAAT